VEPEDLKRITIRGGDVGYHGGDAVGDVNQVDMDRIGGVTERITRTIIRIKKTFR
jgi:hypothetical protein